MSLNRRRGLTVIAAALSMLALGVNGAVADTAPPGSYAAHEFGTITTKTVSPSAATCTLFSYKPLYSGSTITGTGGIVSCTGTPVATCSSEAVLEVYLTGPQTWVAAGPDVRQGQCPPPARSSSSSVRNCEDQPQKYSYRTETIASVVDTNGQTAGGTLYSDQLNIACL